MRRFLWIFAAVLFATPPASPYLNNFTDGRHDHWPTLPATWNLNPARNSNIQGARSVADVIQASFNTWTAAPNAALSANRGGDSQKAAAGNDGINLICFVCTGDFSGDEETLAITLTTVATSGSDAGNIIDADILFNPNDSFSTVAGSNGEDDLQTVATHEIGHFFGLAHSSIVRAIMFPFAPIDNRTLSYDDVAGMSTLYPAATKVVPTNAISGTVRLNGSAVFGAHVFAEPQTDAQPFSAFNIRKSAIGNLTIPDGTYRIDGLPADTYVVIAEPLDGPVTNDQINGYASAFGRSAVQINFTTRWH